MDLVSAHKGGLIGWTTVTGKPGHSSQPDRYVNAVMAAAELIAYINRIRDQYAERSAFEGLDPPYSTIQVNQIAGGLHGNIVAETVPLLLGDAHYPWSRAILRFSKA